MVAESVTVTRVLLKTARASGWVLLFLVGLFLVTGYALSGKYGFDQLIGEQVALTVHRIFDWPLILFFVAHAATSIYFALRRWRVVGNGKKQRRAAAVQAAAAPRPDAEAQCFGVADGRRHDDG
jgi:succinate dehydrogenase/fumarate reductase cytochrome b subunit